MKKQILAFAIAVAALTLAACGDDSSSGSKTDVFSTKDDLPECTEKITGDTLYVESDSADYFCDGGEWVVVGDTTATDSSDVSSSSGKNPSSSSADSSAADTLSSSSAADSLSSSSSAIVSSSSEAVSSSSPQVKPNWTYLNPAVSYGELTDARDGQVYKTVQIGEQIWMAENLNYAYNEGTAQSYCYNNSADSCAKYGRLYLWSAAMDSAAVFGGCGYGSTCGAGSATTEVRGVCPAGWHLPSRAEFETLFAAVGGKMVAVKALKSTSGWMEDGNGTDVYGFSALPAGYYNDGNFFNVGSNATFWSATEGSSNYAYAWYLSAGSAYLNGLNKGNGFAVRCLRNSPL